MARSQIVAATALVAAVLAACAPAPAPIAGVHLMEEDGVVRLVNDDGAYADYTLPAGQTVALPSGDRVVRAVLFGPGCAPLAIIHFVRGRNAYAAGGQLFIGPGAADAGTSPELVPEPVPGASPSEACQNVDAGLG